MRIVPYLTFDGRCAEAFRFYEKCLGGRVEAMTTYRGTPMEKHVAQAWQDKILHARLVLGDQVLMASDSPPDRYQPPQGISVSLGVEETADAERVFEVLSEGGTVQMPLQQTFWAARFGMLVDRFGTPWLIDSGPTL